MGVNVRRHNSQRGSFDKRKIGGGCSRLCHLPRSSFVEIKWLGKDVAEEDCTAIFSTKKELLSGGRFALQILAPKRGCSPTSYAYYWPCTRGGAAMTGERQSLRKLPWRIALQSLARKRGSLLNFYAYHWLYAIGTA
jgi:hypothetical protein